MAGIQDSNGFPGSLTTKATPTLLDVIALSDVAASGIPKKAVVGTLPFVQLAGSTMTGALILSGDPVTGLQAATKQYVDTFVTGLDFKDACYAASTADVNATYANGAAGVGATLTCNVNGALALDGTSPGVGERVLIKNQASTLQNGIYDVTDAGSGGTPFILTRSTDFDTPAEIPAGAWTIIVNGATQSTSSWVQTATVAAIGTDPITFTQFSAGVGANTALSNLTATAINDDLVPDTDIIHNLGSPSIRWGAIYAQGITTGETIGDVLNIAAVDTDTSIPTSFIVLTAGSTPTCAITSSVTGVTQAPNTNTTQLATCAYTDALGALKANIALDNLAGVAINASLTPGVDGTPDLGSVSFRWDSLYANQIRTNTTAGQDYILQGRNTNTNTWVDFFTVTAGNPPTAVLASTVTGTTQAASDNSTKLATTAYVDAQAPVSAANKALSNLASTAVNVSISPGTDNSIDLGDGTHRWNELFLAALRTGTTAADTLVFTARNTGGGTDTTFITLTAGAAPTCAIQNASITGGTVASLASPLAVASGGTGVSSTTAYAVLCGGTTSTNPVQSIASVGTAGQVLTSNGAGALPTFQAAAGGAGALVFIASATASASATISFDNNLSATYDNYLVMIENLLPATNAVTFQCRVGTGAGPTYQATNYSGNIYSNVGATSFASGTTAIDCNPTSRLSNTANRVSAYRFYLFNVNNATTDKNLVGQADYWDSSASTDANAAVAGRWQGATVLTSLRFLMSSGNISTGVFKLYGITNS